LLDGSEPKGDSDLARRTTLGVHPVGWTGLVCMLFFLGFLVLII
jgi:hypothetical protein